MNRRDFQKLTAAAFGGLVAGSSAGCYRREADPPFGQRHVCRGLNVCKGLGRDGKNDCAGQGRCATVQHDCVGKNQCKNQGGCSPTPAANACAGKGGCSLPLMAKFWQQVRDRFEADMARHGVKVGAAPDAYS